MPIKKWIKSTNFAIEGILHASKTQRHLRYHFYSAVIVLLLSFVIGVTRTEFLIISLSVIAVLLAEMFNTAIEAMVDILSPAHSEKAKIVKDIAAGAVFVTAFGAAVIGYIIIFPYVLNVIEKGFYITKHSNEEITIISVVIILILVVMTKTYFVKGHPLKGGMPSGHSAIAFSVWMSVTFITGNIFASVLCFALALLIAQGRVAKKIHNKMEVIIGGLMGAGITFALFKIFS